MIEQGLAAMKRAMEGSIDEWHLSRPCTAAIVDLGGLQFRQRRAYSYG
jgi:hypothetical protein